MTLEASDVDIEEPKADADAAEEADAAVSDTIALLDDTVEEVDSVLEERVDPLSALELEAEAGIGDEVSEGSLREAEALWNVILVEGNADADEEASEGADTDADIVVL